MDTVEALRYVDTIYAAALGDVTWEEAHLQGCSLFKASRGLMGIFDSQFPDNSQAVMVGVEADHVQAYMARNQQEDYWLNAGRPIPEMMTALGTDLISLPEMHKAPFYNDVAKHIASIFAAANFWPTAVVKVTYRFYEPSRKAILRRATSPICVCSIITFAKPSCCIENWVGQRNNQQLWIQSDKANPPLGSTHDNV